MIEVEESKGVVELKCAVKNTRVYMEDAVEHIEELCIAVQRGEIDYGKFINMTAATARKMGIALEKNKLARKILSSL